MINNLKKNLHAIRKFEFFQLVRLLEQYKKNGHITDVFFSTNYNMYFSPTAVESLDVTHDSQSSSSLTVSINFMGLVGVNGALPPAHNERIAELIRNKDHRMLEFFNIFQNRSIFLFYQAWKKYNFNINFEQAYWNNTQTPTTKLIPSLIGIKQQDKTSSAGFFPKQIALFYAGHFSRQQHSASALQDILCDYLQIPVKISQLISEKFKLECKDLSYLSNNKSDNNILGINTTLGEQIRLSQHKFRIQLGPLSATQFQYFLPRSSNALQKLCAITRQFANHHLSFDIQIIIKPNEIESTQLSRTKNFQLGWNTWFNAKNFNFDVNNLFISESKATNSLAV